MAAQCDTPGKRGSDTPWEVEMREVAVVGGWSLEAATR